MTKVIKASYAQLSCATYAEQYVQVSACRTVQWQMAKLIPRIIYGILEQQTQPTAPND